MKNLLKHFEKRHESKLENKREFYFAYVIYQVPLVLSSNSHLLSLSASHFMFQEKKILLVVSWNTPCYFLPKSYFFTSFSSPLPNSQIACVTDLCPTRFSTGKPFRELMNLGSQIRSRPWSKNGFTRY